MNHMTILCRRCKGTAVYFTTGTDDCFVAQTYCFQCETMETDKSMSLAPKCTLPRGGWCCRHGECKGTGCCEHRPKRPDATVLRPCLDCGTSISAPKHETATCPGCGDYLKPSGRDKKPDPRKDSVMRAGVNLCKYCYVGYRSGDLIQWCPPWCISPMFAEPGPKPSNKWPTVPAKPEPKPTDTASDPEGFHGWRPWDLLDMYQMLNQDKADSYDTHEKGREEHQGDDPNFQGDPIAHAAEEARDTRFYLWQARKQRDALVAEVERLRAEVQRQLDINEQLRLAHDYLYEFIESKGLKHDT